MEQDIKGNISKVIEKITITQIDNENNSHSENIIDPEKDKKLNNPSLRDQVREIKILLLEIENQINQLDEENQLKKQQLKVNIK
jgi:hypothetical protein